MMKDTIEEAKRWDLEPIRASVWWSSTYAEEVLGGKNKNKTASGSFWRELQDSRIPVQPDWKIARKLGRTSADSSQGLVHRRPNLQEQRRTVKNEM